MVSKEQGEHDKLIENVRAVLQSYGFETKSKIKVSRLDEFSWFPISCFEKETEVDIYCRSRPIQKGAENGAAPTDVFASDFIIECKTSSNLRESDKNQILLQAKNFPVYVMFPKSMGIGDAVQQFIRNNKLGLMTFEEKTLSIEVLLPAFTKLTFSNYFDEPSSFTIMHEIFEIFTYKQNPDKLCLPLDLLIDRDEKSSWEHRLNPPINLKQLIGIRNKLILAFQKLGYNIAESWAIFSGLSERQMTFQGFNIQSLIFAFESIYSNEKTNSFRKNRKTPRILFQDNRFEQVWSSWHNDNFLYVICAKRNDHDIMAVFAGNVKYGSRDTYLLRFDSSSLFCNEQIGSDERQEFKRATTIGEVISIQGTNLRTDFFKTDLSSVQEKIIRDEKLIPIQTLIKNYGAESSGNMESDNIDHPPSYFYNGSHGQFVAYAFDFANMDILSEKDIKIEPMPGIWNIRNYEIDSKLFQNPIGYRKVLIE